MTPNDVKAVADNIDDFIEVPNGVSRLRKAVLVLAASGKLVPQDPKEGSAEKLYAQIHSDREKTENGPTGRKRKVHDFSALTPEEIPYQIPSSWKWVRLGEVVEFRVGKTPPRNDPQYWSDAKVPWVSIADLKADGTVISTKESINKLALEKIFGGYIATKGTLLFSFKLTIGKMSILGVDACHNEAIAAFFPLNDILRDYLFKILPVINTAGRTSNAIKGKTLNSETLALIEIPLPPISEQKRIVKKVEELMKQLDELEAKKQERDETRARLARSAMQSLGKGESKVAFEHLTELIKTPADLKELEGALLTLAVSGKLLSQDKKEGTAADLYAQIQSKIGDGVKGRKKRTAESAPIDPEELPFRIPKSWKWVRLMEIGKLDTGKTPRTGVTGNYSGDIPFVGPGDVQNGKINSYSKLITKQGASESKYLHPGDVLMVCIGGTIGKTALVSGTHTFNQQINKITPCLVNSTFLFCVFQSGYFQRLVWGKVSGGATPLVNLTRWSSCVVPLPPLAEQKRIVKKVEEVMVLINQLKTAIGYQ